MDLSHLEAFLAVCHTLNFTKAAEHLHISQSAVTARIKALEAEIGRTLFDRDNRNVSLTQAGSAFVPYAERMLRLFEESKTTLSEQYEDYLIMSGPGAVWHYRYLERLLSFRREHPKTAIKFLSDIDPGYMIHDLLLDGTVHVAIRYDPPDHPKVSRQLLYEDEILLVSAEEKGAAGKADFYSPDYCHIEWGASFPQWFAGIVGSGYIPSLALDHSTILLTLLLQGSVFGFLPRSIAQPYLDDRRLFRLPLEEPPPPVKAYASYLTEKRDHASVRLGLRLLGIGSAE
ncbi:LysR family transcriptional regulator [Cohnella sp. AR92]|uniref:LysR family transcriptional regulator n=1 Tax=Cohnella sp. AR92 TaxID=648716 RepID=UPI000F8D39F2|nr:LysR family transcriptional regulator [Cohnella sp. AR92]RUS47318.1 LysR family transcriptional regulator [Cohnella sp. AR92]